MINKLKPKSEFSKNVLTLMTGTTIAQAIPIAISPILTRLYTPEDFGVLAYYTSIVSIFSVVISGKYELAIMLSKTRQNQVNIFFLSILINLIISCILIFVIWFFHEQIIILLNNKDISLWLYFIPFSIFLVGLYNSFNYYYNSKSNYKLISNIKISQSVINSGSNVGFGILTFSSIGLITSNIITQFFIIFLFIKKFNFNNIKLFNLKRIFILAKKYKKFPQITMWHGLLNNLSVNIPMILIGKYFTSTQTGFFMFTNRIIGVPISIISSSIGSVFFKELTYQKEFNRNNVLRFFNKMAIKIIVILSPIFILLFFLLPEIVVIIFGEKWANLSIYIHILLPMFFFRSVGSILAYTVIVFEKQFIGLIFEIISIILRIVSILIGWLYEDIILALIIFSFTSSLFTLYRIYWYHQIIKEYVSNEI